MLEAVIPLLKPGCRVPVAGWVSQYNSPSNNVPGQKQQATPLQRLREAGLKELGTEGSTEGFRFFHFMELATLQPDAGEALRTMSGWINAGKLKYRESVTNGLESCVDAFIGMLRGENFGKTMVRIS